MTSVGNATAASSNHSYGWGSQSRHESYRDHHRRSMSTAARAQLRLRELGYYHGAIDGVFGRYSRYSLMRFQRDHRLYATGSLNERTIRALRLY